MIKVVAFDLDDTLWDSWPVLIRAEQHLEEWLNRQVPGLKYTVKQMRELRQAILEEDPDLANYITELRRRVIERAMQLSGIDNDEAGSLSKLAMDAFLEARNRIELSAQTLQTLQILSRQFTLGALTNGNADIRALGLAGYFKFVFSAEDVGASKPAPDLFLTALEHTRSRPNEMVYVGDDPVLDIDPANRVGLHTVLVINPRREKPGESRPDEVISEISELPAALDRINSRG